MIKILCFSIKKDFDENNEKYDIIFALSVLCRWPTNQMAYTFQTFEDTLKIIDKHLVWHGLLINYNSQYLLTESSLTTKYIPIKPLTDTGFVKKYHKDFSPCSQYEYCIFRKKDPSCQIASLSVSTNNLGDHIQILAMERLLNLNDLDATIYIDRDKGLLSANPSKSDAKIFIVLNGWFKRSNRPEQWPPNEKLIPLFIGFHMRLPKCPDLISEKSIAYYKKHGPIGCRDPYTLDLLISKGVDCYLSNCLTLTFPKRDLDATRQNKIIVSSRDTTIMGILPNELKEKATYINHYTNTSDFNKNLISAKELLDFYRTNAKLVITTFLHAALPCLAMGIPVVVFYPNSFIDINQSDKERFSGLASLIKIYSFSEIEIVNWNPEVPNIEGLKSSLITRFNDALYLIMNR